MADKQGNNRIVWQDWQLQLLHDNWRTMTAGALSEALGIRRRKVREKKHELGYRNIVLEYWTDEQVQYLVNHYKKIGNTELAGIFNKKWK